MGGKTISTTATQIAGIVIQTSSYGIPRPVIYGTNRVSANLLWFGNFTAIPHTTSSSSGGKGLGSVTQKDTTYTYTVAAIMGICEGPIVGIGSVWKDKDKTTLAAVGLTLFTGTTTQSTWSFLTGWNISTNWIYDQAFGYAGQGTSFTDQAISYSGTAYVCSSAYDLGDSASVPNHSFEVQGKFIYGGAIVDANPAVIIPDILTAQAYGIGLTSGQIAPLSGYAASYSNYCIAMGLFMSPAYSDQATGADRVQEICDLTNSAPFWSGGQLKITPRGDTAITGNGVTFTPDLTVQFDLSDDDFLGVGVDPVRVTRTSPADAYNRITMEFSNRVNQYNAEICSAEDQTAIEAYGLKTGSQITAHMFCDSTTAKLSCQLLLQRSLFVRNTYEFELGARFAMLEPMDIVTLTDGPLGMARLPVRIIEIDEQDDSFMVTAEDAPIGIASAARYSHDNGLRWQQIISQMPLSCAAPIIFEMPSLAVGDGLHMGIAVGGQTSDPLYGGCRIWLSLDGTNYTQEGTIYGSSRYGTLSAALAAHAAGTDTASTVAAALRSNAQLVSASTADRDKGTTLINVGGEYLSYQTATLTSTNNYNLTSLNRGLYGTTPGGAASGATFVRVDDAIAVLQDLNLSLIGQTVFIKCTAFDVYRTSEQALSAATAYSYTITGNMKALETPVDFATGVGGITKPAPYAGTSLSLVDVSYSGTTTIVANGFKGNGSGGDWTTGVADKNYYTSGYVAARMAGVSQRLMVGLTSQSSFSTMIYTKMEYAIYSQSGATAYFIYELGNSVYTVPTITTAAGDYFDVVNDAAVVRYYINGSLVYKSLVAPNGLKLRACITVGNGSQATANVTDVQAGPSLSAIDTLAGNGGQNLIYNGGAELGTTAGWVKNYVGGTGPVAFYTNTTYAQSGQYSFVLSKSATSDQIGATCKSVAVMPGEIYNIKVFLYGILGSSSTGLYLRAGESTTDNSPTGPISTPDFVANGPVTSGARVYDLVYIVPAGVYFFSLNVIAYTGTPSIAFEATMLKTVDFTNGLTGTGKPDANATNSALSGSPIGTITAGAVATTILSVGGIASGQVGTSAMVSNAVSNGLILNSGTVTAGNNTRTYHTLVSGSITLSVAGVVYVNFTASQQYSTGTAFTWGVIVNIGGSAFNSASGSSNVQTNSIGCSAAASLAAGTYTVSVVYYADNISVSAYNDTTYIQGLKR
ncbi:hypothetical protein D3Y57_09825 [Sphingomonas paeninsulae]|uniref:Uncharacterized protein n=1 Tax=Sphingomonas paeninsulae TaxID=2319844 RepID=A0A494TLB1_SPHPE|nr:phage tail protein [Sphingomonas paeninsulae]AYJ86208.1 hypothetical protein D3Y57_09825 [Sphingomonas paeninsulae]